ncbi:DUF3800 domain-containing protein [Mesorhizobium sp. Mes31]|uniref:DUF3800 domain-containing protein n=1 Tax=Mesorhizobium sp. Mes31 TaxID=2926017 RepID=UPI0021184642|nr:DUF3800 domain-containing protein [Mesorhizobium sp. Mes31]
MHVLVDETEIAGKDIFAFAAVATTENDWYLFCERWTKELRAIGLDYLHCKEHFTGEKRNFDKIAKFSKVISECTQGVTVISVDKRAYLDIGQNHPRRINFKEFAFGRLIARVMDAMEKSKIPFVSFLCDDDQNGAQALYRVWSDIRKKHPGIRERAVSIAFADDKFAIPLQAADLIAWLFNYEMQREKPWTEGSPIRHAWPKGADGQPNFNSEHWDRTSIERFSATIFSRETLGDYPT